MHDHRSHHRRLRTPIPASEGAVRVGDAERERVVELLHDHAVAGRLDAEELEERAARAYAARYGAELQAALAELPAVAEPGRPRGGRSAPRSRRPPALLPIAVGALIAVAAVTSAWWLLWLIWPLAVVLGPGRPGRRATRA